MMYRIMRCFVVWKPSDEMDWSMLAWQDSLLKTTAVLIRKQGVAGYQENILQMYLSEENT